jgi:hypothetical protein
MEYVIRATPRLRYVPSRGRTSNRESTWLTAETMTITMVNRGGCRCNLGYIALTLQIISVPNGTVLARPWRPVSHLAFCPLVPCQYRGTWPCLDTHMPYALQYQASCHFQVALFCPGTSPRSSCLSCDLELLDRHEQHQKPAGHQTTCGQVLMSIAVLLLSPGYLTVRARW